MATHLTIIGIVQGVGYRESMRSEAVRLNVRGWVRNRRDGSVEAVVDGDPDAVREIIRWAHNGPRGARISGVKATGADTHEALPNFEIHPTT